MIGDYGYRVLGWLLSSTRRVAVALTPCRPPDTAAVVPVYKGKEGSWSVFDIDSGCQGLFFDSLILCQTPFLFTR
ncbi:hypothetical protein V6N13_149380 [Hibiscus sabdariffa]|uniref:Uncharacterized protein n=1 Tax=Hibiscus sabdariffa TaxID=183260 RepID=A0ABR2EJ82_9ROSI